MAGGNGDWGGGYDPAEFARDGVKQFAERAEDETSTGLHPDRHQTHMLRVFVGEMGKPVRAKLWLVSGAIEGGEQAVDDSWFEVFYHGILRQNGQSQCGDWLIRVEGANLEPVCQHIAKGIRTILKCGVSKYGDAETRIERIAVKLHQVFDVNANGEISERE
jgi:hypothetical protein